MRAGRAQKSLDTSLREGYNIQVSGEPLACGFSSSGRASASQAEGGEFEPRNPLHSQRQDVCPGAFLLLGLNGATNGMIGCAAIGLQLLRRWGDEFGHVWAKMGIKKPRCVASWLNKPIKCGLAFSVRQLLLE